MSFRFLEHTADIKFKAQGKTIEKVFEECVLAFSNYVSRGEKIKNSSKKIIKLKADNSESLLYQFLDNLIYLLDANNFIASNAKVTIEGNSLKAIVWGDNSKNYKGLNPIKAATYSEMYIKKTKSEWEAQVVLDV